MLCKAPDCKVMPHKGNRLCAAHRTARERDRRLMEKDGLSKQEVTDNLKILYGE